MPQQLKERKSILAVGTTAHAVQDGLGAAIYVLMPILAQSFGLSYTQVGLFKGLKSLSQGALELFSGNVVERIGESRTLVFGLALSASGYLLLTFAPDAETVALCLLLIGAGTAFHHAPSSALISKAYANYGRRGALGLYNSSGDVGKLIFTGCFSLAVGIGLAWQQVIMLYGLIAFSAAVAIALAMNVFAQLRTRPLPNLSPSGSEENDVVVGWGILDLRAYGALLTAIFFDNVVQAGVLVFVPFLMISKGIPLFYAMLATVIVLIGGVLGKAVCGFLAERIGVRPAFVLVQVLTAVGLCCVVVAPGWTGLVLLAPLGIVAQGSTSITYGIVDDLIDPRRTARGYALMYGSTGIAAAVGPFLFGVAGDLYGIEIAVLAMAVTALIAIAPTALLPKRLIADADTAAKPT